MPLHELLHRHSTGVNGGDQLDGNAHTKGGVKKVEENGAGVTGTSRFKSMSKKMVSIPGKKDVGKRRVFENLSNQPVDKDRQPENKDVKRLKKEAEMENKENKLGNKALLKFVGKKDNTVKKTDTSQSNNDGFRRKRTKQKFCMPDIPIPQLLPSPLIETNIDLDDVTSAIDSLLCDPHGSMADTLDYFCSPQYAYDIITYLLRQEQQYVIPPTFLGPDTGVNPNMRSILIDWLLQVQAHLYLEQTTLHLTVRMIDLFVFRQKVALAKFQLVGITCLLIAAKFEERFAPLIEKLIHLTDNTYTEAEVLHMEIVVLKVLKWQVHIPLPIDYIDIFIRCRPQIGVINSNSEKLGYLCQYLLDLTLHDIHMVQWTASTVAASCLWLAMKIISQYYEPEDSDYDEMQATAKTGDHQCPDPVLWTPLLQHYSSYTESQLMPCVQRCAKLLSRVERSKYQGARSNYQSNSHFRNISHWSGLHAPVVMELVSMEL